jgi:uncharacterized FAD-dependent dehydrogenase
MNITFQKLGIIADLIIEEGRCESTFDLADCSGVIPYSTMEDMISVLKAMNEFNGGSDVDFCAMICKETLTDSEKLELIKLL